MNLDEEDCGDDNEFYNTVYSRPKCDNCWRPSEHKTIEGGELCAIHMKDYRAQKGAK